MFYILRRGVNLCRNTWSPVFLNFPYGPVCSHQTGLGFKPDRRTIHLLTWNRKQFDHLIYTKLKPVYQIDQTTFGCGLFGLVCPNICSFKNKIWRQQKFAMKFIAQKWLFFTKHCCFLLFMFSSMTHWCLPIIRNKVWLLQLPWWPWL